MLLWLLLPGCGSTLTGPEAREALDEAVASSRSEALTGDVIELTTDFTLGEAVEDAAQELADFARSQAPCSTVSVYDNVVTIDFGTLDDACTFNDHTYAGVATVTVEKDDDEIEVRHHWEDLTDGQITVNGDATVTWSAADHTRHVVHALTWDDGKHMVDATGDRTQTLLDPDAGLAGGIVVEGERTWTSAGSEWSLDIDGVEMRGQDPCPQAGTYTLTTPADKVATLAFERVDDDTIRVTLTGTRREQVWEVTSTGVTQTQ
jgi:hypothetical protein